ncbi:DegT/DnrJ/EryC1/StrS aminotransferase family protein [Alphaproteobacteria bacterium]|nr:DegT/DnrJ/EryC1/StrS aminotransferase family protein [Alphaproteobacteria bacterium]
MINKIIPLCKPSIKKNELKLVNKVLKSGWLAHGDYNLKFEKSFAKFIGTKFAISLNSCTSALELALWANDIKGDVLIPSFTWVSTANVVKLRNLNPIFLDIDINSRNTTLLEIKKKITKNTKAIIIVHFAGYPVEDLFKISSYCKKNNILLIEDSAECIGGKINNIMAGSIGIGCFSFYPTKNITTCEGGMITTNSKKLYNKFKSLSAHGILTSAYDREKLGSWHRDAKYFGRNFRMPNPLAAIGYEQIKRIKSMNHNRNKIAKFYNIHLKKIKEITLQQVPSKIYNSYQMYTLLLDPSIKKFNFIKEMNNKGIMLSSHFDPPVHKQQAYKKYSSLILNNTDDVSNRIISLPIYPDMTMAEAKIVVKHIKFFFSK